MRRLKPTQWASGPKLTGTAIDSPFLTRRRLPVPFVPCTATPTAKRARRPAILTLSLIPNYTLYNLPHIRLNIAKVGGQTNTQPEGETHETPFCRMCLRCRPVGRRSNRRARAGQDIRTQAVALGAAVASAAKVPGGMGGVG